MFMNELTPGDKMSLKGKIFELQKKLNLLDVEQQNAQDFSFHPEITGYKLPNRKDDFINNLNQAEETRKERFEALKQQLVLERSEDCSFAPQINRRKKDVHVAKSQKPVFERLTEKGKEYQDSAEKRKEMCKSHDFEGKRLFQPTAVQKPRTGKGNMQVEEYLFRDAKDRVEKMEIKRENEKKIVERIASKQKMNKHSALLVKRKCEREARELFDNIYSCINVKDNDEGSTSELNSIITTDHLNKSTIAMLKYFENNKGTITFHNSVSHATSPYKVVDRVWAILDPDETGEVSLRTFLVTSIPVLVAGGSNDVGTPAMTMKKDTSKAVEPEKASYLYQYLSASLFYFNKKKKQEKENEVLNAKRFVRKNSHPSNKKSATGSVMSSNLSQDSSVSNAGDDMASPGKSDISDGISESDSLKSYKDKAALSRRIQSYNKVLTDREIMAQNRLELLRESLIQKEMEECTFQPRISSTAQKLREKEMSQSTPLDDSSNTTIPVKVYDRLYAEKDTLPRSIAQDKHEPSSNRGLEECTFAPKLMHAQYQPFDHSTSNTNDGSSSPDAAEMSPQRRQSRMEKNISNFFGDLELESGNQHIFKPSGTQGTSNNIKATKPVKAVTAAVTAPRGYSDSIRRIREAASNKKKKEAEDEAFFAVNEERYNQGLQIMAEGPKPFRFRTEERHSEKEKMYAEVMNVQGLDSQSDAGDTESIPNKGLPTNALESIRGKTKKINGELKPIRLFVEIKLGAAKKSHIAVADFDIPILLARDFCKIYGLDPGAEHELSQVVESNMVANGIPIGSLLGDNQRLPDDMRSKGNRRSFADSTTFSSNNLEDLDDEDFTFYENSNPQENSVPLYDHPF